MAHTATSASFRTVSLSVSALFWTALLVAAVSMAPRIVQIAPPLESPPITTVMLQPPPPLVDPVITQRTPEPAGDTAVAPLVIAPAPMTDIAGPAVAVGPALQSSPPPVITRPTWIRRPSGRDLAHYYPQRALEREKAGVVILACTVRTDGNLACRVAEETPTGWGFGDAALRISQTYQMQPAARDGVPVEARYALRVPFELR